jgi:hypothetical protein
MEANKTDKLLDFIRAALASGDLDKLDAHNMAKAADMTVETARASLVRLRRQGVITHEPRDFKTIRIVGETPKRAAPAKKKSAPKASKKKTEPEAASATGDGLEQARTVIYTDDEVARLDALVVALVRRDTTPDDLRRDQALPPRFRVLGRDGETLGEFHGCEHATHANHVWPGTRGVIRIADGKRMTEGRSFAVRVRRLCRVRRLFSPGGDLLDASEQLPEPKITWFCLEHMERGNADREDCEKNLERVEFPPRPQKPKKRRRANADR